MSPLDREEVPAAGTYRVGEAVWVHRHGRWNPGTVRGVSPLAVLVDYHIVGQRGRLTDTVMELNVMRRDERDPLLDRHPIDAVRAGTAPAATPAELTSRRTLPSQYFAPDGKILAQR